jgi:dienelactone hydrolase
VAGPSTLGLVLGLLIAGHSTPVSARAPEIVHFLSGDGKTTLVGYLFVPERAGAHPAIVLLHGRGGVYSSLAQGVYNAATLSKRHLAWSEFWEQRGYVALLVDSFGPRGLQHGPCQAALSPLRAAPDAARRRRQ